MIKLADFFFKKRGKVANKKFKNGIIHLNAGLSKLLVRNGESPSPEMEEDNCLDRCRINQVTDKYCP